ncbi:transposase [Corynebacterium glutamicum MB001]|uniref:Transposase n=2 Tax=Corynebacterium glutamicum TaxID=1718 RepID=Q8NM20_CORGL|nr:transposase [Corynebacterium glutamicum MB001]ASW15074.1 transposase [Corynebacterium glutamicum]CAF20784.1 transposase [Corynebacterium glutamicum ATCC 13032]CCH25886.1 hypothetical protein WA5_2666 [Corynebacterium glutamicum K051]NII98636.1 transposase [Corynebacterium glutamicum]
MPTKTYSEEFKRDAVALYENSDGASLQQIANDLGINRVTLKNWIIKYGSNHNVQGTTPSAAVSEAEQIRQLKKENALQRARTRHPAESC